DLSSYALTVNGANSFSAKSGDTLKLEFTTDETIPTPQVKLAGNDVTVSGSGTTWSAERVLTDSDAEGEIAVELILTDAAGNTRTLSYPQSDTANLLASYPFSGNADDNSNNNTHLTVNGATLTTDRFGRLQSAYQFDGNDDYLTGGDVNDLGTQSVSFSAWFKTSMQGWGSGNKILSKGLTSSGNYAGYHLRLAPDNHLQLGINEGNNNWSDWVQIRSINTVNDGSWHHAVGVIDRESSIMKLYLDGVFQSEGNISAVGSLDTQIPFSIGNLDRGTYGVRSEFFNGFIDDVRIVNTAIDASLVRMRANTVVLDKTKPTLANVSIASTNADPSRAKSGDTVKLSFTVSEATDTLTANINNRPASITGSGTSWVAERTLDSSDPEGAVSFSVSFTDKSGNAGDVVTQTTDSSAVEYDRTAPTAAVSYSEPGPYKAGDVVTIRADFSEDMLADPVPRLKIILVSGTSVSLVMTRESATHSTLAYTMNAGDGIAQVSLDTSRDLAGNDIVATPTAGATFDLDNTAPSGAITYSPAGPYREGDAVTLTVSFTEAMQATPALQLSGAMTLAQTQLTKANETQYTHTLTVTDGNGTANAILHAQDPAGNAAPLAPTSGSTFTLDNTVPTGSLAVFRDAASTEATHTNSTSVTVRLAAQDDFTVTGYYVSEADTTPLQSDFTTVALPATNFSK
ncbi:MAG: LamG domain-containing protein, partial [SAR324 cluster bacterium]|nr:LamG domain-containing protein [SAR324 cluster bacterium]